MKWILVSLLAASLGCYSHQPIALDQLGALTAAPGRPPEAKVKGLACGGCEVALDATTPLLLHDVDGRVHRVTPFYFHMSDAQLVSPDYGVLVDRADIKAAEVRQLNATGTIALIAVVGAAAAGTFLGLRFTAGEAQLPAR